MPVIGIAVLRRVLAHRGDDDAVGEGELGQREWLEQLRGGGGAGGGEGWVGGSLHGWVSGWFALRRVMVPAAGEPQGGFIGSLLERGTAYSYIPTWVLWGIDSG